MVGQGLLRRRRKQQCVAHHAGKHRRQRQAAAKLQRHHQLIDRRAVIDRRNGGVVGGRPIQAGAATQCGVIHFVHFMRHGATRTAAPTGFEVLAAAAVADHVRVGDAA